MTAATRSGDDDRRLEALRRLEVVDTPPEAAFDDLARLAAFVCGTPTALITFLAGPREWVKARIGFGTTEIRREVSFGARCIADGDIMIVPDATADRRFHDNPLVTGPPHIRFYAAAPLVVFDVGAIGTICVIDYVPRQLNDEQRHTLQVLSRQVTALIELRHCGTAEEAGASQRARARGDPRPSDTAQSALLDGSPTAIVTIDDSGTIIEFNPAAERMFQRTRDEAVGRPMSPLLVPPRLREAQASAMRRYVETRQSRILGLRREMPALRADGREFPVEMTVVRAGETEPPVFTAFLRDLTEQKAEQERSRGQVQELQRWHEITLDREDRILELKREVNELLAEVHRPPRYLKDVPPVKP
jgi:putative two-component system response regulator